MKLTASRTREVLAYDGETGVFTWRTPICNSVKVGSRAGCIHPHGYRVIRLDGKPHRAHRLAFLWMTGAWPSLEIDHINGDRDDCRWANLREVTREANMQNQRRPMVDNKTGFLGVVADRGGRYRAGIGVAGVRKWLGTFDTPEQAHAAYIAAKRELHPGGTL